MTLLETAQSLKGEELDAWLATLSLEETLELCDMLEEATDG